MKREVGGELWSLPSHANDQISDNMHIRFATICQSDGLGLHYTCIEKHWKTGLMDNVNVNNNGKAIGSGQFFKIYFFYFI